MNNKKLRQLVKEALSNMVDEDDTGIDSLEDPKMGTALSANELYSPIDDEDSDLGGSIKTKSKTSKAGETTTQADDHYQNVEEHGVEVKIDPDADDLADDIINMADAGLEEETFELREFFEMDEMARTAQSYKLTDKLTNAGSFLQRVNDRIKAKTMGAGGRGRKAKEFSDEDISNMLDVLGQSTFTSQDVVSAIGRFDKVQPVNAILAKMRDKGYIDYAAELKKSAEPTSSEPKRRGRPAAQKPEDEFDAPEGEPEMGDIDTGMGDTKEQLAQLTAKMRQLAKQYAQTKDQGIVDQLRQMTKQKRDLEGELGLAENKLKEGFRDPEDNYGFGDVKYEIDDYAIGDEVIVVKGGERMVISKTGIDPKTVDYPTPKMKGTVSNVDELKNRVFVVFPSIGKSFEFVFQPGEVVFPGDEPKAEYDDDFTDEDYDKWDAENLEENNTLNESKKSKKGLLQERFQQLSGIKPMYAINSLNENLDTFLNSNFDEVKGKIGNIPSKFKIMGDPKVATAGLGEKGIDVSFDKEHLLSLFPEEDPYNEVESIDIAGKTVYYNNYLADDEPWTDPAGGTHYGDEDDPAAAYLEEKNTLNESKKQLLTERFKKLANIK